MLLFVAAVCVADGFSAHTYDNKTYQLNLEKDSWYVLMTSAPKQRKDNKVDYMTQRQNNVSILVKENGQNKKDVKIILNNGENVIEMQPASSSDNANARIQVNKKEQRTSKNSVTEVTNNHNERIAEMYALPSGEVIVNIPSSGLRVNYDGARVMVEANDRFRDGVRGLCGSFTGEKATDFLTPRNCIVKESKDFIATYSLSSNNRDDSRLSNSDFCTPQKQVHFQQVVNEKNLGRWAKQLKLKSGTGRDDAIFWPHDLKLKSFFGLFGGDSETQPTDQNKHNDSNYEKSSERQEGSTKHVNFDRQRSDENKGDSNAKNQDGKENNNHKGSSSHRTLVVEQGNQLCFSIKSMPQCNTGFRAENTTEKTVRISQRNKLLDASYDTWSYSSTYR